MAMVWIPAMFRPLAGGADKVEVAGATLAEVIDGLEAKFPGFRDRLVDADGMRPEIGFAINSEQVMSLAQAVPADAEVYLVPAIAGG